MRLPAGIACLLLLAGCRAEATVRHPGAPEARTLSDLIACNDSAIGGDALRQLTRVEFDLQIREPTFEVDATYVAERRGTARIDIFDDGRRVFSEGWDGSSGWQLPAGATEPRPTSPEAGAPLRHGLEQPGHLWTLRDMPTHGHRVDEDASIEREAGERVIHLTLADGFENWLWLDTATCHLTRKRDFRAYHPDVDSTQTWLETRFADFRASDGVTRAWLTWTMDLATGDTVGVTRLTAVRGGRVP